MKLELEKLTLARSLSGNVYIGVLNKAKDLWLHKKDVTNEFEAIVKYEKDKTLTLQAEILELRKTLADLYNAVPNDGSWNYQAASEKARQLLGITAKF